MSVSLLRELLPSIPSDDVFQRQYDWLISDWAEMRWEVRDPGAHDERPGTMSLNFESPLRPGHWFSDHPEIVEDIKRSLALSVELGSLGGNFGPPVNSYRAMYNRLRLLMRIYRELYDLGLDNLSDVDAGSVGLLLHRLSKPEKESRSYAQRVEGYFQNMEPSEWPVIDQGRGRGWIIDRQQVYLALGFSPYVGRFCGATRSVFGDATCTLAEMYPDRSFRPEGDGVAEAGGNVAYQKEFRDLLATLHAFYTQSDIPELFNYPLSVPPYVGSTDAAVQEHVPEKMVGGRTRNIPVDAWMTIMDAAVRFVVDYAEPLKRAEEEAAEFFSEIETQQGRHVAGKRTGKWLRQQEYAEGLHSPFPLSAYANYAEHQKCKKYTDKYIESFKALVDSGQTPKQIKNRLGLRKPQYDYLVRLVKDRHIVKGTGLSLHRARYSFLPLACVLVLLAFTAGRESSIRSLRAGCIKRRFDDLYIEMFIPKTLRRYDQLPTVEIVEKAVKVLEDLSESARRETGRDHLFHFRGIKDAGLKPQSFRWDSVVDDFVKWIGLEVEVDGEWFNFSEHQFRRFFAMMFFYRYDKKYQLSALMRFMRHLDWNMTTVYLSEKVAGQVLKQVSDERGAALIVSAVDGKGGGSMAEEFKSKLLRSFQVQPENKAAFALKAMQEGSYVFDFIPDGVCFGRTPGYERRGKCTVEVDGEAHIMTHRQGPGSCAGCPNLLTSQELRVDKQCDPKLRLSTSILEAATRS